MNATKEVFAVIVVLLSGVAAQSGRGFAQYNYGGGQAQDSHGGGHAESFSHFVGPVAGHAQPVVYKDKHGEQIIDYVAQPHYEYVYGVADHHTGDFHGQKESHDGHQVVGEYSLKEPSGNVRTVKYVADKDGFHAQVHNSHGNTHPAPAHGGYASQGGYSSHGR